jgi:WD40 repeat protein
VDTLEAVEVVRLFEYAADKNRIPVVSCLDVDRFGKLLAVGGDDHKVRFWDVEQRKFVMQVHEHLDWVRDLSFSPDRSKLATISQDGQIQIWDVQSGLLIRLIGERVRGMQSIAFSPDGRWVVVCGFDKFVRIYGVGDGLLVAKLESDSTGNRVVLFSPDGLQVAVAGRTGLVRVWSTSNFAEFKDIKGSRRRVNALAFSADGSKLAVGGDGPFITVFNPRTGARIRRLPEHPGKTYSLVFCDDNRIASGESDNAIRIWDIATRTQTAVLIGHTGTVAALVYDNDKKLLISSGFDTSIRFWNIANDKSERGIEAGVPNLLLR